MCIQAVTQPPGTASWLCPWWTWMSGPGIPEPVISQNLLGVCEACWDLLISIEEGRVCISPSFWSAPALAVVTSRWKLCLYLSLLSKQITQEINQYHAEQIHWNLFHKCDAVINYLTTTDSQDFLRKTQNVLSNHKCFPSRRPRGTVPMAPPWFAQSLAFSEALGESRDLPHSIFS